MKFPKTTSILIVVLLFFVALLGYNYFQRPFVKPNSEDSDQAVEEASDSAEVIANQPYRRWQLDDLSPEQKVGQLLVIPFNLNAITASDAAALRDTSVLEPGGYIIFGSKISAIETKRFTSLVGQSQALDAIPTLIAVDHEGGDVQRLTGNGFSILPSARELCRESKETQIAELKQSAQELALAGIHMVFGPSIDVASNSSVLKSRSCSGDSKTVSQYGEQFVAAFSSNGVFPVLKHYPGIGSITQDLHTRYDQELVLAKDVEPFRFVLNAYPRIGVMVSHMGVVNQIPGLPCSMSADCIDQLMSTNPQALVLSDSLTMKAVAYDGETDTYSKSLETIALSAIMAGNQMLVFGPEATPEQLKSVKSALVAEYLANASFAKQVDIAVVRILDAKEFQIFK